MRVGERVEVHAAWSSFRGMHGTVTATRPHLMVVFDDDPRPLRIEEKAVFVIEQRQHMTAGD